MQRNLRLYNSCEFLPLWNFFKINEGDGFNVKYLVALSNRLDYAEFQPSKDTLEKCERLWINIFEEYNTLERNANAINFVNNKAKIILLTARYQLETALIMRLMYKTSASYIAYLRTRGYHIANTSHEAYAKSLTNALKRVRHYETEVEMLVNSIKSQQKDNAQSGNPYDLIMAWIISNDIRVDENITVSRYIKIKEVINEKLKAAKRNNNGRAKYHR